MKNYAVSNDDIEQALEYSSRDILARSIVLDSLGADAVETEQFARHLAAYKNRDHESLVEACKPLVMKYSTSITASKGCFLDEKKTISVDFDGALKTKLENLVAALDSALTGSNPAVSILNARGVVDDWSNAKTNAISKRELSNGDLSIELNLATKSIAISPSSRVDDSLLMEASPIINELNESVQKFVARRVERNIPSQSFSI